MNKTCETCKFWNRNFPDDDYGRCEKWQVDQEGIEEYDFRANPSAAISAVYESTCELQSGPDFGCIHHTPKENEHGESSRKENTQTSETREEE